MAQEFQSSFIPKGSMTEGQTLLKKKVGFLGYLVISLFSLSTILALALFAYKSMLKRDIKNLQSELAAAGENIDKETIGKMVQFSKKLQATESIVSKHRVISGFLNSLSSSTVSAIFFNDFNYVELPSNDLSVTMRGRAPSYGAIALQESVFSKNKYWKSVTFSNLSLEEKGKVGFEVRILVDPQIAVYTPPSLTSKSLENLGVGGVDELDMDTLNLNIDDI